ncbi:vitronectin a isoform X1 [Brachyhypopomus gauderio]|uniref:vitronectin a isoform X1 n=1 Tax=Brachyhypopomus gauderio TaxID=698409 RepID=UPI00404160F1
MDRGHVPEHPQAVGTPSCFSQRTRTTAQPCPSCPEQRSDGPRLHIHPLPNRPPWSPPHSRAGTLMLRCVEEGRSIPSRRLKTAPSTRSGVSGVAQLADTIKHALDFHIIVINYLCRSRRTRIKICVRFGRQKVCVCVILSGKYFFELGVKSVLPGYPKLIEDVWGIKGPIDAAFTRFNCQGKTYVFKGNQYWRFDDGVLDQDFPRNISVGFENVPADVDGAIAMPAHSYHGREKAYFFKGDQYYQYEFKQQPSHEECFWMTRRLRSSLFTRYADMYRNRWTEHFSRLFGGYPSSIGGGRSIDRDWIGVQSPVDAVLVGRLYVSPGWPSRWRPSLESKWDQQWSQQRNRQQQNQQQWDQLQRNRQQQDQQQWDQLQRNRQQQDQQQWDQLQRNRQQQNQQQWDQQQQNQQGWDQWGQQWVPRRRQNRSPSWETIADRGVGAGQEWAQRFIQNHWSRQDQSQSDGYRYDPSESPAGFTLPPRGLPLQSVYFFKGDQYYRVNLWTRRVDRTVPPYPRPIGTYWLGCPDDPGAEKR